MRHSGVILRGFAVAPRKRKPWARSVVRGGRGIYFLRVLY